MKGYKHTEAYPKANLYRRIVKAKLFMDAHFSENIPIDNIADEGYISKFHFIRTFKKAYGKTPHQYLVSVRIDQARALLKQGQPVADTCYTVGFDSIPTFSRLFKRQTGHTPAAFRKQQLTLQASINEEPLRHIPSCHRP